MTLTRRKNGVFPSLLPDFFSHSALDRNLFDLEGDFLTSRLGFNVPAANITETPKEFKLDLAVPGLERKDFSVEVDDNHVLTVTAEKEEEKKEKKDGYSRKEYAFNSFSRSFGLPDNIREGDIDASYANGVLTVAIPKAKETPVKQVRKVEVS